MARSRATRIALGVTLTVALVVGAKAARTYQRVRASFHAPHQASAPSDATDFVRTALRTSSGVALDAWAHSGHNGATVVFAHGARSTGLSFSPEARALGNAGYGTLLVDMPGCGGSGGDATWGRDAQLALTAAIDHVAGQGASRIGVLGFSMGSSVAAHVASVDPRVRAVVLSGAFTNVRDEIAYEYRAWGPITSRPALAAAEHEGLAFDALRTTDVIASLAPRPLLVVAGSRDEVVPLPMARALFERAGEPKAIDVIEGAGHGDYARVAGDAYLERLRRFFDDALLH